MWYHLKVNLFEFGCEVLLGKSELSYSIQVSEIE